MDIQAVLQTIIEGIVVVVVPVVTAAAVQYFRTKVAGTMIEEAMDIILDAVDETNQTFADQLRKDGTFTPEKQKEALAKSLKASIEKMNDRLLLFLEKEFNDVEAWITQKIEAACKADSVRRAAEANK